MTFCDKDLKLEPIDGGGISTAHNFSFAYSRPGHVVVLQPHQPTLGYSFKAGLTPLTPETPDPETLKQAIALTETAHHMFYSHQYHMPADHKWPQYTPPSAAVARVPAHGERKSVVEGKSVSVGVNHGGRRLIKKKKKK